MDEEKERQDNETSDPLRRLINKILINKMSYEDEIDEGTGYLIGSVITLIILLLYYLTSTPLCFMLEYMGFEGDRLKAFTLGMAAILTVVCGIIGLWAKEKDKKEEPRFSYIPLAILPAFVPWGIFFLRNSSQTVWLVVLAVVYIGSIALFAKTRVAAPLVILIAATAACYLAVKKVPRAGMERGDTAIATEERAQWPCLPDFGEVAECLAVLLNSPQGYLDLAARYSARGDAETAISLLERGHKARPDSPKLLYYYGTTLAGNGDTEGALRTFAAGVEHIAHSTDTVNVVNCFCALANMQLERGDTAACIKALETCIRFDSTAYDAMSEYALVPAMTEPDGDRALEWLRKASELGSLTYRDYPTMAIAYFKKGDYTSARRYIDDILYTTKDSSAAMLELAGDIYMKVELEYKGKRASDYTIRMWREKGREFYRKALERAPGNKALADKLMRAQAATE